MTIFDRAAIATAEPQRWPRGWVGRHLRIGAWLGVGIGLLGQLAVSLASIEHADGSFFQQLAALIYSAASWTLFSLVVAFSTRGLLRWPAGRVAAIGLSVALHTSLSVIGLLGVLARTVSGDYLTVQAVQFLIGSGDHVLHAIAGPFRLWALGLFGVSLGLGVTLGHVLRPAARLGAEQLPRKLALVATVGAALVGTGFTQRSRSDFVRGMFESGPLLALASSLDASFSSRRDEDLTGRTARLVPPGPSLDAGDLWERLVEAKEARDRPNVLILMLESVNSRHLGRHRAGIPVTPELDRIASEGLRLRNAWATATHSNYAQMAVLSSLLPYRTTGLDQYERLDYPRTLWHDLLHELGYVTATISSQDESWQGMRRFQDTGTPTYYWHSPDFDGPHVDIGAEAVVPDERTIDEVTRWIASVGSARWGVYVNLQATHFPYNLPPNVEPAFGPAPPTGGTFNYFGYPLEQRGVAQRRHDNALAYLDGQVGRLRRFLESRGLLDHTLWIVTADHGENFGEHGMVTHGRTLYSTESHVPLFVRWPGHVAAGEDDRQISHVDVLPTLADLLGVPPHPAFQGRSFAHPWPADERPAAAFMVIQGLRVAHGLVCYPWKLAVDRTTGRRQLFHLGDDPDERFDRATQHPSVVRTLYELLAAQRRAQLAYHEPSAANRRARFAPRLARCPELPAEP